MKRKKTINVFLASPGDLKPERQAFLDELRDLNRDWGKERNVEFRSQVWEHQVAPAGPRVQGVINELIDDCDVFIMAIYKHWGQSAPDSSYSSYTEEEFHRALDQLTKVGKRRINIFVFFKNIDRKALAAPDPQLSKVLEFREELDRTKTILSRSFTDVDQFRRLLRDHLCACAEGTTDQIVEVERTPLPLRLVANVKAAREKHDVATLDLAIEAATAAEEGRIEVARQKFAKVVGGTANGEALFLAFDFYRRVGDLKAAEEVVEFALAYHDPDAVNVDTAAALAHFGIFFLERGNLEQAERLERKSLDINKKLGCQKGIADQYCRLGIVLVQKHDWSRADEMFEDSVDLNRQIDRPRGLIFAYREWALAKFDQGEHSLAKRFIRCAMDIAEDEKKDVAYARCSRVLGDIHQYLAEYKSAIKCYRKSKKLFTDTSHKREARQCQEEIKELR